MPKKPRNPQFPQESGKQPQQPASEAAPAESLPPIDQAEAAPPQPAADERGVPGADDEAPTTPLKESVDRARQLLAARRSASSGTLPAITPEMLRAAQQTNEPPAAEPSAFSQRVRERRRASRPLEQTQAADKIAEDPPKPDGHLPLDEMAPAQEASPLEAVAKSAPPTASNGTPKITAKLPAVPAPGNGVPRITVKLPAASTGTPKTTAKLAAMQPPSRTRRLPETGAALAAEAADGEITEDGERAGALALVPLEVGLRPRTEPIPAIGISRKGLLSEDARRERTLRVRAEANRRWRRRRRYALYVMSYQRRRQERQRTLMQRTMTSVFTVVGLVILVAVGYTLNDAYIYYQNEAATLANLPNITSRDNAEIFDSTGKLLFKITADGVKHYIPLSQVSINVINATIATEDKDFWINDGIDFTAIVRAATADLNSGANQGGSTITQQLIKNTVTGGDDTLDRKIKEAILAIGITQQYSKEQILEMYLNSIGYGENAYGIDAAALEYFNLPDKGKVTGASQLDLAQASMLAGLPKNPNRYDPFVHLKDALARQKDVLQAMVDQGYINKTEALRAEAESAQPGFLQSPPPEGNLAPHFVYWIEDQLANMIDSGTLPLSLTGLRIYTTLDLDLQNQVQQILQKQIQHLTDSGQNVNNGAALILDQHTGAVLVMLGSEDYYNQAIQGYNNVLFSNQRQVGSAFKPITYATAFEKGWFPAMPIYDGPTAFPYSTSFGYKPLDYSRSFTGQQTVRTALQNSLNVPAVKTLEFAGVQDTVNMANRLGVTTLNGYPACGGCLAMTLGSLGIPLFQLTSAYSTFANYGVRNPPFGIWRITDQTGKTIYQYTPHGEQVVSPQIAYLITSILSDNAARTPEFGPCSPLYLYDTSCSASDARPAAAKTGTTEDFRDDLAVGYTMDYTMGVWVGNTDNAPTNEASGIVGAAPIWHDSMLVAEGNRPFVDFPVPPGVEKEPYCGNGVCSTDWFITGAVPDSPLGNSGQAIPGDCLKIHTEPDGNNWTVQCSVPDQGPPGGPGPCFKPPCPPPPGGGANTSTGALLYRPTSQGVPQPLPVQNELPQQRLALQDIVLERLALQR